MGLSLGFGGGTTGTDTNQVSVADILSKTLGTTSTNQGTTTTQKGTTTNTAVFDPAAKAALDAALGTTQYDKNAAISDAQAASQAAMQQILQQQAPGIAGAVKASGGYNSTTGQMLNNDLAARTSAAGAQVILDTISKYATAKAQGIQAATGAVEATKSTVSSTNTSGTSNTTGTQVTDTTQQQSGTTRSGSSSSTNDKKAGISGGTVICTQLHKDGKIPTYIYFADIKYVARAYSGRTIAGYHLWAVPFVRLMRKNKVAYAIGSYFGIRWSYHMASKVRRDVRGNILGWVLQVLAVPTCWLLGFVAHKQDYTQLWLEA